MTEGVVHGETEGSAESTSTVQAITRIRPGGEGELITNGVESRVESQCFADRFERAGSNAVVKMVAVKNVSEGASAVDGLGAADCLGATHGPIEGGMVTFTVKCVG
ncbi:hypothetical protein ACM01_26485 [Streptomyces viridochromogenes]|uniref:Uncharacterized protein n=1 Tax=Streptomyces viridochromogenes TaxID=1938 RepID=A0A0J7Z8W6_STRVR|nr:hypothetical protein ACM01_26485 [Streptomyces viridochromogenes]